MTWYVYVDWTTEAEPRPFYVGKGNDARLNRLMRNRLHTNIKRKYGFAREVVMVTSVEEYAMNREKDLIAKYKTNVTKAGHWGANLTDGGEGNSGGTRSPELRKLLGERIKAAHARPDVKARHRAGCKAGHNTPEAIAEIKARYQDVEWSRRRSEAISRARKGKPLSEKALAAVRASAERRRGTHRTEDEKRRIGLAALAENRKCKACGEMGHYKHTCPKVEHPYKPRTCKLCGQQGHIAKGCYRRA